MRTSPFDLEVQLNLRVLPQADEGWRGFLQCRGVEEKISYHDACRKRVNLFDEVVGTDDAESLADRLGFEKTTACDGGKRE